MESFPVVILRLSQQLALVKRKAEVSPIPQGLRSDCSERSLAEGLTPAKSAAISKLLLLVSDLKQGDLNQIIALEDVFFL